MDTRICLTFLNQFMGNLIPLVAVVLAGPAIIALIFYRQGL